MSKRTASRENRRPAGQVLLLVMLLLLLAAVFANGLYSMWQSTIQTFSLERDSLIAFYLAQAGVERAKIWVKYNVGAPSNTTRPDPANATEDPNADGYYEDLNIAPSNYHYQYNFTVANPGGGDPSRTLTGRGRVLDSQNTTVAAKTISLDIDTTTWTVIAQTWNEQ